MSNRAPVVAPPREETDRERIHAALRGERLTPREISERARVSEKDVAHHLDHLSRSARARGERLVSEPASCLGCGFLFEDRGRPSKPGRCPECRGTRISPPRFGIAPG